MDAFRGGGGAPPRMTRTHLLDSPGYKHSFCLWPFLLSPILSVQLYIYLKQFEEWWSCIKGSGISSAEVFSTYFFGRLLKIWLIEQQLGEKLRKLIQDGETYDNVSYDAWVFFKPIVYLGTDCHWQAFSLPPTGANLKYTKLLTLGIPDFFLPDISTFFFSDCAKDDTRTFWWRLA